MNTEQLLEQIERFYQADEHQKIVDMVLALPETERADELMGQLAVAYNNLDNYNAAIAVLEQLRPRQEDTDKWQYRMGYALYYLDRNQEAKDAFSRCLFLDSSGKYAKDCQDFLEWIEEEISNDNDTKDETADKGSGNPKGYSKTQGDAVDAHNNKYFGDYPNIYHKAISSNTHKKENDAEAQPERIREIPPVVDSDIPDICEQVEDFYNILMDKVDPHLQSLVQKKLPIDEINAYNHLAIYLRWCIEQELMSKSFAAKLPELMLDVQSGKNALDLREQLRDRNELNHTLIRSYFNTEGAAFAAYYYSGEDEDAPYYPADVDDYAEEYFGKERYNSDEFQDEAYLFVPFDEASYQGMKQVLDRRYRAWTEQKEQLAKNNEPSRLAIAMMKYLDCPCQFFPPALNEDHIIAAYHEAVKRSKREGFVPILVAADDETLWESLLMNSDEDSESEGNYSFNPETVAAYRKEMLNTSLSQGKEVIAQLLKTCREEAAKDGIDWDKKIVGEIANGEENNEFLAFRDYSALTTLPMILAEIPVKNSWEIFAYLPFGNWNECPDTPELMAVIKYWFELYGAVPAVMNHDVLEFALPAPVEKEQALLLAQEQYAWCPDIVDQGGKGATVGRLADGLTKSKCWYFWWD